jgi:hypothetical protein
MTDEIIYPVCIVSQRDKLIARVNPDSSWSVKWDEIVIQAYEPPDARNTNVAVTAICRLLLAARDNFVVKNWDAQFLRWDHTICKIGCYPTDKAPVFTLIGKTELMAYVNLTGKWAVNWNEVRLTHASERHWGSVAINGFCLLLLAAKDNFVTTPFTFPSADQEGLQWN